MRQSAYKIVSEYDQEIPQSQTADKPEVPRRIATCMPGFKPNHGL